MSFAALSALMFICADGGLAFGAAGLAATTPAVAASAVPAMPSAAAVVASVSTPKEELQALAFGDQADDAVVDRVLASIESITTLTGNFTQVAPSGSTSKGKFYLHRPGLLRFEYEAPSPLLIVATGGSVYVRDEALETTDSYPLGKTPLKFLLRKRVELGDAKVMAVDRGVSSVAVTFASKDDETDGDISIILTAPALQLKQWIVRDPQQGVTIVSLNNVVAGEPIDNRLFSPPKTASPFLKN